MKRRGILLWLALALGAAMAGTEEQGSLRIGFSKKLFSEVNEADAIASIKVWADTILVHRSISMDSAPVVYPDAEAMKKELLKGSVDMVALLSQELFTIEGSVQLEHYHFITADGQMTGEYILLVQADSGIEELTDLQGKTIAHVDNARMALSWIWLDTLLIEQDIPDCFSTRINVPKPSRAVMAVFFKKADACLVSRKGYETMVELNPQIGKALRVLETSPQVIRAVFCMRAGTDEAVKQEVLEGMGNLGKHTRGQQILTAFRADDLVAGTPADLDTTRQLCERHALLRKQLESRKIQTAEVAK